MKPHPSLRLLLAAVIFLAAAPAARSATAVPRVETMENGLTIVLLEDHASPLVAEAIWVHTGGKDESEQLAGFSHYLEHLIPMGTQKRAARQQLLEIFRMGGLSSIQADYDRTFFFAEVESSRQDAALEALYQQVVQATLPDKGVDYIRPQITRELKEVYDDPNQVLFFEQMRAAFPGQPYRFPYFGNFNTLASLEHTTAQSFYGNFYVPNNMVVTVGGDINPAKTLSRIKALFGALKASKALPAKPKFETAFTGARSVVKNLQLMPPSASILFPTPGYRHPDRFSLAVLARLLDDPVASPLSKEILGPGNPALSVSSRFHLLEERGLLEFTAFPALAGKTPETTTRMLGVLKEVRSSGFPEADVARVVRQVRLEAAVQRDTVGNMIQDLARGALFGDVRYGWELETNLGRVTAADVKRVAATYLAGENGKTLILLPKEEKSPTEADRDRITQALSGLDSGVSSPPAPDFSAILYAPGKGATCTPRAASRGADPASRFALPNGLVLLVKPDRGRGMVAASLEILAGSAFDPEGKEGLAQMVASSMALETSSISGGDFRRRAGSIGSTFGITAFRESVEAGLTVFPEDLPEALTLLAAPVTGPRFPESEMGAVRDRIRRFGEALASSPQETARAVVREKIYRGHPYGRNPAGTEVSLASIGRDDLVAFHRRYYRPDRSVLVLAGDVTPEEAQRLAASAFSRWTAPTGEAMPPELPAEATAEAISGEFSRVVRARPASVLLGFPAVSIRDPDFPLVRALGGLLSARGTLDLVLDLPLANSVSAVPEGLSRGGILYVEASTPASDSARVAYEILLQARALGVKEVTEATVKDLVTIERGRLLREKEGLYTLASNLGFYELLGAGFSAYDEGRLLPPHLTPTALKQGAERFLNAGRMVRVTAGPESR